MGRSPSFRNVARAIRIARYCEEHNISTSEGLQRAAALEARAAARRISRREFLANMGKLAVIGGIGSAAWPLRHVLAAPAPGPDVRIAIVGAGLAGLTCGDELNMNGIKADIYDANDRVGGRCFSLSGVFPDQVAERGGEFIDTLHKTMLGYAKQFNLALEDVEKTPGEVFYFFNGQRFPESAVVDEFRDLVAAMRDDLRTVGKPTADSHTAADAILDFTNLRVYLNTRGAGTIASKAIEEAYIAEYGVEIDQQSCLSFLLFIHADRRSKFRPFGVFSDERYHVIGGNEQIVEGLRDRLNGQIQLRMKLAGARKNTSGEIELTFENSFGKTFSKTFDAVVFAIPFSTLREVELDASLGLPEWKLFAIRKLRYGTNAKMMVGFDGRPWLSQGSNGASYSDLPNHQTTWETNPTKATALHAILTDYSGGNRGASLNPQAVQKEAMLFLSDLDQVYPGALAVASRQGGNLRIHLEHWPSNPFVKGSYTSNHPGYFTTIADNEAKPVGNLYFAGEHTSSFYEFQGFMEGAALSGIRAAREILHDIKVGALQ
jgi:monoamine oxidase